MTASFDRIAPWVPPAAILVLIAFSLLVLDANGQSSPNASANLLAVGGNIPASVSVDGGARATLAQWRAELAELAVTTNAQAERAITEWLDRMLAGEVAKEVQLEVLEAAASHRTGTVKERLLRYQAAGLEKGGPDQELLYGGDADRGRKVFFEKPEAQCVKCHRVGPDGGQTGPLLSGVATNLTREGLWEAILFPNATITKGYETIAVVLKDRSSHHGTVRRENETELVMDCPPDGAVTIRKVDIASRRKGSSLMPDGFGQTLSRREQRDVIEFLATLR